MDPLVVAGGLGEQVGLFLRDGEPFGHGDLLAHASAEVGIGEEDFHGCNVAPCAGQSCPAGDRGFPLKASGTACLSLPTPQQSVDRFVRCATRPGRGAAWRGRSGKKLISKKGCFQSWHTNGVDLSHPRHPVPHQSASACPPLCSSPHWRECQLESPTQAGQRQGSTLSKRTS